MEVLRPCLPFGNGIRYVAWSHLPARYPFQASVWGFLPKTKRYVKP